MARHVEEILAWTKEILDWLLEVDSIGYICRISMCELGKNHFTEAVLEENENCNTKKLAELSQNANEYIESLNINTDAISLNGQITQELECPISEWIRYTVSEYLKLFKGEKSSSSSTITRNNERTLAGEVKMERKLIRREVDLLFKRQQLEYGCSECGRFENQTKELYDSSSKRLKVLKDMLYNLHMTAPNSLRGFKLIVALMLVLVNPSTENKFPLVLCDSPMRYVTRITRTNALFLSEETDDITIKLLPILKTVYSQTSINTYSKISMQYAFIHVIQ